MDLKFEYFDIQEIGRIDTLVFSDELLDLLPEDWFEEFKLKLSEFLSVGIEDSSNPTTELPILIRLTIFDSYSTVSHHIIGSERELVVHLEEILVFLSQRLIAMR